MAPEVMNERDQVGTPADVYSLGITIYELMLNTVDLPTNGPLWKNLRSDIILFERQDTREKMTVAIDGQNVSPYNTQEHIEERYSQDLEGLIKSMMTSSSKDRITIDGILRNKNVLKCLENKIKMYRDKKGRKGTDTAEIYSKAVDIYRSIYDQYSSTELISPEDSTTRTLFPREDSMDNIRKFTELSPINMSLINSFNSIESMDTSSQDDSILSEANLSYSSDSTRHNISADIDPHVVRNLFCDP